ncbi:unnamed protein product [Peronospora belbahrii]|uniref:Uncharacterized protein n=1 Tax=Peronospora belbahrii TaxID=622444 RepID=A0AAU9L4G1_9STRA|nr:unnamed protein product [Peronospora belbahrii]
MEINNMKAILIMAIVWNVPARHGDVPSAYPKAKPRKNTTFSAVPQGMPILNEKMEELGASNSKELAIKLKRNLYGLKQAEMLWY